MKDIKSSISSRWKSFFEMFVRSDGRKGTLLLLCSNFLSLFLGACVNILITRFLGVDDYSRYAFLISIFTFSVTIISGGWFDAINRAIVIKENAVARREYYGILILILFVLSFVMGLLQIVYALFDPMITKYEIQKIFIFLCVPTGIIFLCAKSFDTILRADNRIKSISASVVVPRILMLMGITLFFLVWKKGWDCKLECIWSLYIISFSVVYIAIFYFIKPSLRDAKKHFKKVVYYWKNYGLNMYVGCLFTVGSNRLTPIFIGYWSSQQAQVSFYTLAIFFTAPLLVIPNTIATSNFERFSKQAKLTFRNIFSTIIISFAGLLLLFLILPVFFRFFYTSEFWPVIKISYIVALAYFCWGLADFFVFFSASHGKSKVIRNIYFCIGIITVISNYLLIPSYGATGGAVSLAVSSIVYLGSIILYCFFQGFMPEFHKCQKT